MKRPDLILVRQPKLRCVEEQPLKEQICVENVVAKILQKLDSCGADFVRLEFADAGFELVNFHADTSPALGVHGHGRVLVDAREVVEVQWDRLFGGMLGSAASACHAV